MVTPEETSVLRKRFDDAVVDVEDIGGLQNHQELWLLFQEIALAGATSYLEIGCRRGFTFYVLAHALREGNIVLGVDLPDGPWGDPESRDSLIDIRDRLVRKGFGAHVIFENSHSVGAFHEVEKHLVDRRVDILFIDGDHTFDGVAQDYRLYRQIVRYKGLIAFHDIAASPFSGIEVPRFWKEVSRHGVTKVFLDDDSKLGIGVLLNL